MRVENDEQLILCPFKEENYKSANTRKVVKEVLPKFYRTIKYIANIEGKGILVTLYFNGKYIQCETDSKRFNRVVRKITTLMNEGILIPEILLERIISHIDSFASTDESKIHFNRTFYSSDDNALYYKHNESSGVFKYTVNGTSKANNKMQGTITSLGCEELAEIEKDSNLRSQYKTYILEWIQTFIRPRYKEDSFLIIGFMLLTLDCRYPIPAIQLIGPPSSGKTFGMRLIKKLLDPSSITISTLPNMVELSRKLHNNFITAIDNTRSISQKESDFFCAAITRTTDTKRAHFTNNDDYVLRHRSSLILAGITPLAIEDDLFERIYTVPISNISKKKLLGQDILMEKFNASKKKVLSAFIQLLLEAIDAAKDKDYKAETRFAAAEKIMFYAAETLEVGGGKKFLKSLKRQKIRQRHNFEDSNSYYVSIIKYLNNKEDIGYITVKSFFVAVNRIAKLDHLDDDSLPCNANQVTRKLSMIISQLEKKGYKYHHKRSNSGSLIRFYKFDKDLSKNEQKSKKIIEGNNEVLIKEKKNV